MGILQVDVHPSEVGLDADRLRRVADFAGAFVEDGHMVGTDVLVARHGRVVLRSTAGLADRENAVAVADDTLWRIFSMTKPIASVALMMLHEQAKFRLDDPLSAYIPEFADLTVATGMTQTGVRLESPISAPTVRQLLSHSAGFSYGWFQDTPVDKMYQDAKILSVGSDLESMVSRLAKIPLAYQPGTQWRYSVSTDVVGRLVEVLSGQSFDQYLQERIFEPLGMSDTRFHVPEEDLDRFATVYGPSESGGIEPSDNNFLRNFIFRTFRWCRCR